MTQKYNPVWNLDVFFTGGSASPELQQTLEEIDARLDSLLTEFAAVGADVDRWAAGVAASEEVLAKLGECAAFVSCLMAQDVRDRQAVLLYGRLQSMFAKVQAMISQIEEELKGLTDEQFNALTADPRLADISFTLEQTRKVAVEKMDKARELLAGDLAVDGYHALNTLYETVVGRMTVPFEGEQLSVGQAANRFSDPDRAKRKALFTSWEEAWAKEADLIAHSLNHLAGFRLNLYRHRGWEDILKEPLQTNHMTRETLDAMWSAVSSSKERLKLYLDRKAQLLGAEKMAWYDTEAPIGESSKRLTYDEAATFIEEQFAKFSPRMAQFARHAFENRWIEAEDRPYKRPGGFCTTFPVTNESRIFMTFSGTPTGQSTLAHELGHAYHAHVMKDLRELAKEYPMNLAETASTFAELIVSSAAIEQATEPEERKVLLAQRLDDAVAYLMNIHARFLFETRFYGRRRKGQLSVDELNSLMEEAQKEAFADGLECYHPYFWASKLHFYITAQPFYNFPYTFGYLFSAAIYARAKEEGPTFEQKYVDLLRDTGSMTVEDLARKHLGADVTDEAFWKEGLKVAYSDLEQFLAITE